MKCINSPKKHNAKSSKASCWVVVERKLIKFLASGINSTPFYITLTCAWKGNQLKKKQITTATEIKKIFIIIFVFQVQSLLWVVFMTMTKWPVVTVIDIIYLYRGFSTLFLRHILFLVFVMNCSHHFTISSYWL